MKPSVRTFAVPAVAAALLGVMIATNAAGTMRTAPGTVEYFERVKGTIEGVPMQSGPWLGVEIPVIAAAQELLQPNKIMQRRYTNAETREWFDLLIVHCGDVRDMLGHYPPVCYKANGWTLAQRTPMSVEIRPGVSGNAEGSAIEVPAMRYAFEREYDFVEEQIRIINLFALPKSESDVSFGRDLSLPDRAGRFRSRARLGSAQVQIIVPAEMDAPRRDEIVATAMELVSPVLLDVERGPM
jgi:hypothetical protein